MLKKTLTAALLAVLMVLVCPADSAEAAEYSGGSYVFSLPGTYMIEETQTGDIVLGFLSTQSVIRVYFQELKAGVTAQTYIEYGNAQVYQGKAGFKALSNAAFSVNGYKIREIGYYRPLLENIADKNYYCEMHLIDVKNAMVITFLGKTAQENYQGLRQDILEAVKSVRREQMIKSSLLKAAETAPGPEADQTGRQIEIGPDHLLWGRFYPGAPEEEHTFQRMLGTEAELNHKFELLMTYCAFPLGPVYPEEAIRRAYADGRMLMLTLQPFTDDLDWVAVPGIIAGQYDREIRLWAQSLKRVEKPIFVRPLNEMNGDWDPWCSWYYGKDNDLYILAWRRIVDIFRANGADNVLFVWNPHDRSYPDFVWNNPHLYYPGDDYVDWIGLTGYNNGTSHPGDVWREFDEIYEPLYADYMRRYGHKPFMITEFSSNEAGGDKAAWIEEALASLAVNYPNIKIAVWFDRQDNKWLYQLDSSTPAFAAFKRGLGHQKYRRTA